MKERGMIFNGEMVRAILDGRKTQTRRIMKVHPSEGFTPMNMAFEPDYKARWYTPGVVDKDGYLQPAKNQVFGVAGEDEGYACPFGVVGDRLWVRETWQGPLVEERAILVSRDPDEFKNPEFCEYAADGGGRPEFFDDDGDVHQGWKPSIHMPRWASRITLEITDVRVERLASISTESARAEGYPVERAVDGGNIDPWLWFRDLWDGIYPDRTFKHNPWVWVIEFREAK